METVSNYAWSYILDNPRFKELALPELMVVEVTQDNLLELQEEFSAEFLDVGAYLILGVTQDKEVTKVVYYF